jgi:hypothetical protein
MAKGSFTAGPKPEKDKKTKGIRVEVEGQVMEIIREDGKDPIVTGGTPGQLDLKNLPPDTVVFTHTNPTCGWYYWNGKWWYL